MTAETIEIVIIGICLVFSAFFSASETAITSLGSLKAKHIIDSRGKAVRQLSLWLKYPGRVLTTILVFNNVVNILASAVATDLATRYFDSQPIGIATGVMTFLILIFGEIIPKSFAKAHHEKLAVGIMRIVYGFYLLSYPIVWALSEFATVILKLLGGQGKQAPPITEEELEFLINVGERAGVLEETKKDMLTGVFDFDESKVREIMTPRTDIQSLSADCTFEDALQLAIESGFSRIPICDTQGIDHVIGILLVKDLLRVARRNGSGQTKGPDHFDIRGIMREPFFIPESKASIEVFKELKRSKNHIAICVDEHGGTAGLVTMEDIIEEIVGEIQDEYDKEEADILELEPGIYDTAASINIDDFLEFFGLEEKDVPEVREQDIDTVAGWITALLGELPEVGTTVRIGPLNLEVTDVERQRIQRLRVSRIFDQGESEEGSEEDEQGEEAVQT